jgi:hypothetical protein
MDATDQPGTTTAQPAPTTTPGSPWATRFWKTILTVAAFYLALWVALWLYIHPLLDSHPACPTPPYVSAGTCAYRGELHVPQWVYRSWQTSEESAGRGAAKVGELLVKNLSNPEGQWRVQIVRALPGLLGDGNTGRRSLACS